MGVFLRLTISTHRDQSAVLKMNSLFFVGVILSLMVGDIVGPGNGGGDDDNDEPPHRRSSDDEVHFFNSQGLSHNTGGDGGGDDGYTRSLGRQGRQSILGCMMGCTRELRPVRGEQGGNERLFANKCAFSIERCRAQVQRKPQLPLSADQSAIHWP